MSRQFHCLHFLGEIRLELGGLVQSVFDLSEAIAARGHRITLATCDTTDVPEHWHASSENNLAAVEIASSHWVPRRICRRGLHSFGRLLDDVDVVHLHTPWDPRNLQLMRILRRRRIPYVVTTHGMLDDWSMRQRSFRKRAYLALGGSRLFKHATTIHLSAEAEREQASRWVPIDNRGVIHSIFVDLAEYNALPDPEPAQDAFPQINPTSKKVLFLSRLHEKKGVELLLHAAVLLRQEDLSFQLLLAGPGAENYVRQLKSLVHELGLDNNTLFLGMVRGKEKQSLFQLADVFVLPTYQENFGMVLPEAMASGTPVVTTRGTDIWRELERGGAKIAELSPRSLAEAIRTFLSDQPLCDQTGLQGQQFVREWLDCEKVASGYEQMYRNMIDQKS